MSTTPADIEEVLVFATELAKSNRNVELMDRLTILHGYVELRKLDANNVTYQKYVDEAVANLLLLVDVTPLLVQSTTTGLVDECVECVA